MLDLCRRCWPPRDKVALWEPSASTQRQSESGSGLLRQRHMCGTPLMSCLRTFPSHNELRKTPGLISCETMIRRFFRIPRSCVEVALCVLPITLIDDPGPSHYDCGHVKYSRRISTVRALDSSPRQPVLLGCFLRNRTTALHSLGMGALTMRTTNDARTPVWVFKF